jgi:signal transduction histidine kinase
VEDLSLHILDIAENSINAGATLVQILLAEDREKDLFSVVIKDNGKGIPGEVLGKVLNPFYTTRTTRNIGLGLSLLAQSAKETGGSITIDSKEHEGTVVNADFKPSHIDMKPLGNIADTLIVLITGNPQIDFVFSFARNSDTFSFDTREIKAELEGIPINSPSVISAIRTSTIKALDNLKGQAE